MDNTGRSKLKYPAFVLYIVFGAVLGAVIYFAQAIADVSIPSWLKAVIVGVGIFLFTLAYARWHKRSES